MTRVGVVGHRIGVGVLNVCMTGSKHLRSDGQKLSIAAFDLTHMESCVSAGRARWSFAVSGWVSDMAGVPRCEVPIDPSIVLDGEWCGAQELRIVKPLARRGHGASGRQQRRFAWRRMVLLLTAIAVDKLDFCFSESRDVYECCCR